ncbi:MAG: molecular chaperone HscB [Paraglaciecola sp.]|jgi:molecular chaperone HscB
MVRSMNYFALFNIVPSFEIDSVALSQTYQTLQKLTHPDKFATASEREKRLSVQKNAQVNDAYHVLKSPLSRAEHMLELRGLELKHEQQTIQDTPFLMQQMEWREQLEDMGSLSDPLSALEALEDEIQAELKVCFTELKGLLDENTPNQDQQAANLVRKVKFLIKLRSEIELKEEALSDI